MQWGFKPLNLLWGNHNYSKSSECNFYKIIDLSRPNIRQNYTDRNFVDKCSQQVMHFDHEATY